MSGPESSPSWPEVERHMQTLTVGVLDAARRGEFDTAMNRLRELAVAHPQHGVVFACLAASDYYLRATGGRLNPGQHVQIAFLNADTGRTTYNADDVPPPVRWAGRFVGARAVFDADTGQALIRSVQDEAEFAQNVLALLQLLHLVETGALGAGPS